jgi:serine/threonine protein kinase/tetratricopeptide (TPR) repeat protein
MNILFERLRRALEPKGILLERELAQGGMGTVFLGQDVALQKPLAVKALRLELLTAEFQERFRQEASILANLLHPNIVPVHNLGEADGIPYYTMDFLEGTTLEDQLKQGPLDARDAIRYCRQLLDALALVHRRGVIHRDIKPSNVFLVEGRAVLTDFGIAKRQQEQRTEPGTYIGTPNYSSPEQLDRKDVTSKTDLYSLGMVLYESVTGRNWSVRDSRALQQFDWRHVAADVVPSLRRALAEEPGDRWADAQEFQRALWQRRGWKVRPVMIAGGAVLITALALGVARWLYPVDLHVTRFSQTGGPAGLGDSLAHRLVSNLTGFPDFRIQAPAWWQRARATVSGAITVSASQVDIQARLDTGLTIHIGEPGSDWQSAADQLTDSVLFRLFRGSPLDAILPGPVLPKTPKGLWAFLTAEKQFAQGHWTGALAGFKNAIAVDSTCILCLQRATETQRWLGDDDTTYTNLVFAHLEQFPAQYRTLIRIDQLPLPARFDTLEDLVRRRRWFVFGPFRYGDELLHRGSLIGRRRAEAAAQFRSTLDSRPDFAPALEHLAWLWVAEGDSAQAEAELNRLRRVPPGERSAAQALVETAALWRFNSPHVAEQATAAVLGSADSSLQRILDAGARYLNGFDTPHGAVWVGHQLESSGQYAASPLIAQTIGYVEQGQLDSARSVLRRIARKYPSQSLDLFALELEALLYRFAGDRGINIGTTVAQLRATAATPRVAADLRTRAAWMAAIIEGKDTTLGGSLGVLLSATETAARGDLRMALRKTEPLRALSIWRVPDPCFRTVLQLLRAQWLAATGARAEAVDELRWYQNSDQAMYPRFDPQPMEVDWAFGPLARWQQARLLAQMGKGPEDRCAPLLAVDTLWKDGAGVFAARADSASREAAALKCRAGA